MGTLQRKDGGSAERHIPRGSLASRHHERKTVPKIVANHVPCTPGTTTGYSSGFSVVPVARYSACEIAWHRWEQPVVAAFGVTSTSAEVLIFPVGTYRHHIGITAVHVADACAERCLLLITSLKFQREIIKAFHGC